MANLKRAGFTSSSGMFARKRKVKSWSTSDGIFGADGVGFVGLTDHNEYASVVGWIC